MGAWIEMKKTALPNTVDSIQLAAAVCSIHISVSTAQVYSPIYTVSDMTPAGMESCLEIM